MSVKLAWWDDPKEGYILQVATGNEEIAEYIDKLENNDESNSGISKTRWNKSMISSLKFIMNCTTEDNNVKNNNTTNFENMTPNNTLTNKQLKQLGKGEDSKTEITNQSNNVQPTTEQWQTYHHKQSKRNKTNKNNEAHIANDSENQFQELSNLDTIGETEGEDEKVLLQMNDEEEKGKRAELEEIEQIERQKKLQEEKQYKAKEKELGREYAKLLRQTLNRIKDKSNKLRIENYVTSLYHLEKSYQTPVKELHRLSEMEDNALEEHLKTAMTTELAEKDGEGRRGKRARAEVQQTGVLSEDDDVDFEDAEDEEQKDSLRAANTSPKIAKRSQIGSYFHSAHTNNSPAPSTQTNIQNNTMTNTDGGGSSVL